MTSATAANLQTDPERRRELQDMARDYLAMSKRLLHPPPACLVAIGGYSGSGKSSLAFALAPLIGAAPGGLVIRSDEIRKRLCGVAPLERLGLQGYTPEVSRQVYATLTDHADIVVRGGYAAVVDAVYARPADRNAIEETAAAAGVPFLGLWLDAPESVLIDRAERRRLDASDAGAEVVRQQLAQDTGSITWHRVDASSAPEEVARKAIAVLREHLNPGMMRVALQAAHF